MIDKSNNNFDDDQKPRIQIVQHNLILVSKSSAKKWQKDESKQQVYQRIDYPKQAQWSSFGEKITAEVEDDNLRVCQDPNVQIVVSDCSGYADENEAICDVYWLC